MAPSKMRSNGAMEDGGGAHCERSRCACRIENRSPASPRARRTSSGLSDPPDDNEERHPNRNSASAPAATAQRDHSFLRPSAASGRRERGGSAARSHPIVHVSEKLRSSPQDKRGKLGGCASSSANHAPPLYATGPEARMGRRCSAIPFCLEVMLAAVVLHSATGFQSLQLPPGGCSGASLQRARNLGRSKGPPQLSCAARESGEASGDGGGSFTGGDDLAIRMMISRNRSQRDAEERVYMPLDVAVRWARMTRAWTSTPYTLTLNTT